MSPTGNRQTVRVDLGARSYDIVIDAGALSEAGRRIAELHPGARAVVVTDANVDAAHGSTLRASLERAGIDQRTIVVPPGERTKSFDGLAGLVDGIIASGMERNDVLIALGGGVVGDLAGFAAGIVRRGMPFIQIPTSLLAQVDSSVGGKTGINSPRGKNLIGLFNQPDLVLIDTDVLDTLPRRELLAGYAETVKYGAIDRPDFFAWLEENGNAVLSGGGAARTHAIATACRAKAEIVAADEREGGVRALLNLGHTFGHALEACAGYDPARLVHGEGVAIGMMLAHQFSAERGHCPQADVDRLQAHLSRVGLPVAIGAIAGERPSVDRLMEAIAQDKKVKRGKLTFILTDGIGRAFVADDVAPAEVRAFLERKCTL